jgi:hypothetical protein
MVRRIVRAALCGPVRTPSARQRPENFLDRCRIPVHPFDYVVKGRFARPAAYDFRQEEPHDDHHHYRL